MAVITIDATTLQFKVQLRPDESFQPSEEVTKLAERAKELRLEYAAVVQKVKDLLVECDKWNKENDKILKENLKKAEEKKDS